MIESGWLSMAVLNELLLVCSRDGPFYKNMKQFYMNRQLNCATELADSSTVCPLPHKNQLFSFESSKTAKINQITSIRLKLAALGDEKIFLSFINTKWMSHQSGITSAGFHSFHPSHICYCLFTLSLYPFAVCYHWLLRFNIFFLLFLIRFCACY